MTGGARSGGVSIFIKILLMILVTYVAVVWASIETHRRIFRQRHISSKIEHAVNLCRFIAGEVGSPPDTARAGDLARWFDVHMRIEAGGMVWSRPESMEPLAPGELEPHGGPEVRAAFDDGIRVQVVENGTTFQFLPLRGEERTSQAARLALLLHLLYLTAFLALIYLVLRWQLRPLDKLRGAVVRVSSGDLDYAIDSQRRDELGTLVRSFDSMRAEIVEMIRARDRLLLDVSHEFRSPLTRMRISLEMMGESDERENLVADIAELETMVTELLEGARIQSPHGGLDLGETGLADILEDVCRTFDGADPGVELRAGGTETVLMADPARLRLLFRNVIANAVKYSPAGGEPVEVTLETRPGEVVVTVRDHGCGIPEDELPLVFEPFYRVDKSRSKETGGYGLGMHLSKKIMEAHGGRIEIGSAPGGGTTVRLVFEKRT